MCDWLQKGNQSLYTPSNMLIVHGVYHWWPKRLAFRNDYCLTCKNLTRAQQIRTFEVGHIFWIPLLPAGFWKYWKCIRCGKDPHQHPGTRRYMKWLGLVVLILFTAAFWIMPIERGDEVFVWAFRIGSPLGAILTLIHLQRTPKDVSLKEMLAQVMPTSDTICPFCGTGLMFSERCFCPKCNVVRV